jgi:Ketopantoate reductase PanE/ApbA C terminal
MLAAGVQELAAAVETLDLPDPRPLAGDEVLIEVRAAGVANWDELVRTGEWDVGRTPPMALGVAAAQGIELDADPEELIDHAAKPEVAYGHKASMLQDVEARRQTEVDYLNGGIVRFGRERGVPTPLNAAIQALVKGVEASWTQS